MPFKSEKQRKWMHANEPDMAKKWEKEEEAIKGKLRNLIKQEIKSINEGFDKYYLGGLGWSVLKKKLEIAIKKLKGKVDGVGMDYIHFRMPSSNMDVFTALIAKLDKDKNVWIGDKRKKNIWDRRRNIDKLREGPRPGHRFLRAKQMVFLPGEKIYFDPMTTYFWTMGPHGGPDLDDDPIEPSEKYFYQKIIKKLKSKDRAILKKAMRTNPAQKRIRAKQRKEATTSVSVPCYLSPEAFSKSTQKAIDFDDEDDEKNESVNEDVKMHTIQGNKRWMIKTALPILKKYGIKKVKVNNVGKANFFYFKIRFATDSNTLKKLDKELKRKNKKSNYGGIVETLNESVNESMAAPFRRRKSRGLGRPMKVGLNESSWSQPLGWSSPEAKVHVDKDITKMSKHLGKTSHDIIKIMMSGVKGGKYDAMDLQRGMKEGDVRRTHYGEMDFIQELWHKVRDGFRRYSKRGKLR